MSEEKKKIAVLTTFAQLPVQYALIPAVLNQLRMLVRHGYEPHLFCMENSPVLFEEEYGIIPEGVVLRDSIPFMHFYDYLDGTKEQTFKVGPIGEPPAPPKPAKTNFKKQVKFVVKSLEEPADEKMPLSGYETVITHDIVLQGWFVAHNAAIREIAKKHKDIRWIHWLHSGPNPVPDEMVYPVTLRYSNMPNSIWVTMNETMTGKFAEQYNTSKRRVKFVYHPLDIGEFLGLEPLTNEMIKKHNLFEPEILIVWPVRFDHPGRFQKQLYKAVWIAASLSKLTSTKMIFINSWSHVKKAKHSIKQLRKVADEWGLAQEDLVFTSEMGKQYEKNVPRRIVRELYSIGNMMTCSSASETFSLVVAEAALTKNFLILNEDLPVLKELYGEHAFYVGWESLWGGLKTERDYQPNVKRYMSDQAKLIYEEFQKCKPLMAQRRVLKYFFEDWIVENQLRPLLEGDW